MAVFTSAAAIGASILGVAAGTVTFATVAVGFLAQAAVSLAISALAPKPRTQGANRGYQVTTRGSALDHQIIYGRMRVGGAIVYDKTTGTNNKFLHRVIAFTGHEVESFDEVYIDDEVIEFGNYGYQILYNYQGTGKDGDLVNRSATVILSGLTTSDATFNTGDNLTETEFNTLVDAATTSNEPINDQGFISATITSQSFDENTIVRPEKYLGKIRINTHLGSPDQDADSDLVAEVDDWTEQHRLRGIAYLYIRLEFDQNAFPNGVPDITATISGKKVYDPRKVSHDADDPDTWEWSDNPCLCLRDYLSSGYGLSEEDVNIDDDLVIAGANVCDETNTISGEKRFTCNGAFVTQVTPIDILNDLLTSMGGLLWYAQGQWRMKPAYYVEPTLTFTEDDLRSNISVRTRHSRRDNFNTVKGTFRGEDSNWQVTDYPEVSNSAFVAADNGQESVLDLELPFTDNADEARRIARIVLERNRQQLTVSASFGLRAFQVQTGDIIKLSVERFGWTEKEFEVTSWTFGLTDAQDLQVQMTLREISESVFDEIDDGIVYERDNTTLPSPFITVAPQNLTVSDGGFTTDDGTFVNSFIVDWDAPDDAFVDYYELEWRSGEDSVFKGTSLRTTEYQIAPVVGGEIYEIRVKTINTFGVSGPYVSVISSVGGDTTAPSIPTEISATGGFKYITIDWTNPTDDDFNYIEVWENTTNSSSGSTLVGEVSGNQFVRTKLNLDATRFYFLRSVDYSGNTSAYTSGVSATTTFLDDPDFENGIRTLFEEQGLYPIEDVESLPASGVLNRKVFNRADGKLYEWNGTNWVLVISAVEAPDIDGQLQTNQIALDAVTNDLIANDAVQSENIANLAVNESKISSNAVTTTKISNSAVNESKLANNAATEAKIATNAISETKIASGAITTPKIAAGAVTAGEIAAGSIITSKIAAGAVTAGEIAAGSIITSKIAAGAVTAGEIAAGTITSNEIATNTITASEIAVGAITTSELAAGSVTATEIAANSIISSKIAAGAVTATEIAADTITSNEITSNTITANNIATGTITASEISGNTITGNKIVANTITGGLLATSGIITNSAQINNGLITNAKIQNAAITTAKIDDAAITNAKIDDAAITTAKIDDLAVVTAKIQDLSVETLKIDGNAVTSGGSTSSTTFTFTGIASSPVLIFVLFDVTAVNSSGTVTISLNGTQVQTFTGGAEANNVFGFATGQAVTGTNTVSISESNASLNSQTVVQLKR